MKFSNICNRPPFYSVSKSTIYLYLPIYSLVQAALFSGSPPPPGSRPSTVDSRLKSRQDHVTSFRPRSAGPAFETTDFVVERIQSAKEDDHHTNIVTPKAILTIPEYGSEGDILEMHPNVPTPEPGYYDDLNRMCNFLYVFCDTVDIYDRTDGRINGHIDDLCDRLSDDQLKQLSLVF